MTSAKESLLRPNSGLTLQTMYMNMSKAISLYTVQGITKVSAAILGSTFLGNLIVYALETHLYDDIEFDITQMSMEGLSLSLQSSINYGVGYLFGRQKMFKQASKLNFKSPKLLFKSVIFKYKYLLPNIIERLYLKTMMATLFSWFVDKFFEGMN